MGLRFDKALFRSHPEFNGAVQARVISAGRMLVVAQNARSKRKEDPVIASFLSFLAEDMVRAPRRIAPLDRKLLSRIDRLAEDVETDPGSDLGNEALL